MWIAEPGRVTDEIEFVGTREICLYLVRGRDAMLIGGGMSHIAPLLEKQLSVLGCELRSIAYLVIPHSHFDHCGAVPYLKQRSPQMQVLASGRAAELFARPKVIAAIAHANAAAIEALGLRGEFEEADLEFDRLRVDRVVADGDALDLGEGIEARFIDTPGHTRDSLAVYLPHAKAMFPSDAAPCPLSRGKGLTMPSPQHDFSLYVESLRRLSAYDVDVCAFDHHGVLLGEGARTALQRGLERTDRFRRYILRLYEKMGDLESVADKVASDVEKTNELPFLSPELQAATARTSIRKTLAA